MISGQPEVSVVIPTRNRWPLLSRTLAGALRQREVEFEVIVVDDCSGDQTPDRLDELDDPRVRAIRHDERRHVAAARNTGIAAAAGRWLAFLDDDDLWSPVKLRRQLDSAAAADAAFAYSASLAVSADGVVLWKEPAPDPERILRLLLAGNWVPTGASNVIARTDLVRSLGGFDPQLRHFADWDMWLRLAARSRAGSCPQALVAYVVHEGQMVLTDYRGLLREFRRLAGKHELLAGGYGVTPDRVIPDRMGILRWLGSSNARRGRRIRAAGWYALSAVRRSPYGRRRSLADARAALLGDVQEGPDDSIDEETVQAASWLDEYG